MHSGSGVERLLARKRMLAAVTPTEGEVITATVGARQCRGYCDCVPDRRPSSIGKRQTLSFLMTQYFQTSSESLQGLLLLVMSGLSFSSSVSISTCTVLHLSRTRSGARTQTAAAPRGCQLSVTFRR